MQLESKPDLYDPISDEVRLGLAARQVRMLYRLVEDPNLWTDENAPHHLRSMVDARITTAWLLWKNDPEMYARYKAYGQGKLKLLKLNFADAVEQSGFSRSNEEALKRLEAAVNEDTMEEFQPIFVTANFADRPIRKMAEDVGLKDLYDLSYSPLPVSHMVIGEASSAMIFVAAPIRYIATIGSLVFARTNRGSVCLHPPSVQPHGRDGRSRVRALRTVHRRAAGTLRHGVCARCGRPGRPRVTARTPDSESRRLPCRRNRVHPTCRFMRRFGRRWE